MEEKKKSQEIIIEQLSSDLEDLTNYLNDLWRFLPLPLLYLNPLFIILDINKALENLFGLKAKELIGEKIEKFLGRELTGKRILEELSIEKKIKNKEIEAVIKERRKIFTISASSRQDFEGNILGYYFAFSDITPFKELQEKLEERVKERTKELERSKIALINILEDAERARRKAEEETKKTLTIITNFADGLLVFDKEGKLFLINPQAEEPFNIKGKEIIGKTISELSQFPNLKPLVDIIGKKIKRVFRKELPIKENLILEVSTSPIIGEEEKLGDLVILHDITREKIVEKMKTEFVSIAAHQLRTPLSAIKWTLRMLLDGDLGEITKEQKEFIEKTYISNERMISLINDLLNVTRIEEGKYLYKPVLTEFESVVQSVINSYKGEIEMKRIKFGFLKQLKKLPLVIIDIEKMSLAIQNLLDNAVKYTSLGGQVTISLKYDKKEIEFSVKDTGVGIPKGQQERVFTKFFRGVNVIKMATEGSGLGLFIAKNIIEAHGGRIWFESEEGKGTSFYFTIPVKEEF